MAASKRARRAIEAAWRAFVADGRLGESVRPEIQRSWQRARADWHVDPTLRTCPCAPGDMLAEATSAETFRAAAPIVEQFGERLAPDGHVVAYFDAAGVLLALHGNARTRSQLADVNFAPGACWAESVAGTNGIGTALVEARPIEVFASEHFVEAWQPWTCASAPVRSDGTVVGVVDITSPWSAYNPALLLTAEALARAIEAQLANSAALVQSARALEDAQEAARARDEFLAVASHELKTPLTPLQLKLQTLQRLARRAGASLDPDELVEALRGADQQVARVVEFINDLLEASRAAHAPIRLVRERTDLGATARAVVERYRPALARQGCDVVIAAERGVVGHWDAARVEQLLKHLLVNAMKFAPGLVEVIVDAHGTHGRIVVRDHGPGISPEDRERLFLPFERGVSYLNGAGCGLGLHLVRQIVQAHGGEVHVETATGRGCTFVVELPFALTPDARI